MVVVWWGFWLCRCGTRVARLEGGVGRSRPAAGLRASEVATRKEWPCHTSDGGQPPVVLVAACGGEEEKQPAAGGASKVEVFSWWTGGGEAKGLEAMIADFKQKKSPIELVNAAVAGGSGTNAKAVLAGCQGPPSLRTTGLPAGLAGAATSPVTGTPPLKPTTTAARFGTARAARPAGGRIGSIRKHHGSSPVAATYVSHLRIR